MCGFEFSTYNDLKLRFLVPDAGNDGTKARFQRRRPSLLNLASIPDVSPLGTELCPQT